MAKVRVGNHRIRLPQSRLLRIALGVALIIGGILGFLPVLGFWMIPLGLTVLALDFHLVRRARRRFEVWFGRRRQTMRARRQSNGRGGDDLPD